MRGLPAGVAGFRFRLADNDPGPAGAFAFPFHHEGIVSGVLAALWVFSRWFLRLRLSRPVGEFSASGELRVAEAASGHFPTRERSEWSGQGS